ncbi:hypothetical protein FD755_018368, partial [Muntiacus reevesi]
PPGPSTPLGARLPHLSSGDVVLGPGGFGQPLLHPVLGLRHHEQPVLGLGPQFVLRPVFGPRAGPGVQLAVSPVLALALPLEGGGGHGLGLGGLQPRVAEDLVDVQAPGDVRLQHPVDEVLALARQVLGAREVHAVLLLDAQHLLDVGVVVRHGAADHDVEDDAQAPDVVHLGLAALGEAEVGQLDVEVLVEEEVLALEVSVDDVQVVAVLDGRGQLVELLASIVFLQGPPGLDELEEVALDPELHDDVDLAIGRLEDLHGQNLNFPGKEFLQEVSGGFLAVDDLDRHVELEALRVSGFDFGVRALSQIDPHDVASSLEDGSVIHGAGSAQCP